MLWLLDTPGVSGLFNLGTGTGAQLSAARRGGVRCRRPCRAGIEFIDMPASLCGHYQSFTEARMERLRAAGYAGQFMSLEDGMRRYVQDYPGSRTRADPYL